MLMDLKRLSDYVTLIKISLWLRSRVQSEKKKTLSILIKA